MNSALGELPGGWEWSTIGGLCERPQYGFTTKAASQGALRFLRTTDISRGPIDWAEVPHCAEVPPDPSKYQLETGDIVVSRSGSVGLSALVNEPPDAVFASYLIRFRPIDPRIADYLALFLRSALYWEQVEALAVGVGMNNINAKKLASIVVPVPPLAEQQAIVQRVRDLQIDIDLAREDIMAADELADTLEGALTDAAVDAATAAGECVPLSQVVDRVTSGARDWKPYYNSGTAVFVLAQNVRKGRLDFSTVQYVDPPADDPARMRCAVRRDDVLVTIVGAGTGTVARVADDLDEHFVCQSVALIRPTPGVVDGEYLERFLLAPSGGQREFSRLMYGQGRPHLGFAEIKEILVPVPPIDEQKAILKRLRSRLEDVSELRDSIERSRREVDAFERAVLRAAFAGELQAGDNEPAPPFRRVDKNGRPAALGATS